VFGGASEEESMTNKWRDACHFGYVTKGFGTFCAMQFTPRAPVYFIYISISLLPLLVSFSASRAAFSTKINTEQQLSPEIAHKSACPGSNFVCDAMSERAQEVLVIKLLTVNRTVCTWIQ